MSEEIRKAQDAITSADKNNRLTIYREQWILLPVRYKVLLDKWYKLNFQKH